MSTICPWCKSPWESSEYHSHNCKNCGGPESINRVIPEKDLSRYGIITHPYNHDDPRRTVCEITLDGRKIGEVTLEIIEIEQLRHRSLQIQCNYILAKFFGYEGTYQASPDNSRPVTKREHIYTPKESKDIDTSLNTLMQWD